LIRASYQFINARAKDSANTFMNYGYSALDGENPGLQLNQDEQFQRYSAYLYYRVAQSVDLKDRDYLEVGCGRGGGSALVKRQFEPHSVTGIDFAPRAIEFCKRYHHVDGLHFKVGDAENLPFAAESFDVVASVESSHCYPNIDAFLREAHRVLRPNGHLLLADFRNSDEFDHLRDQFVAAGFDIIEDESITKNVVHALDLDSQRRLQVVNKHTLRGTRRTMLEFTGVAGSRIYTDFSSGFVDYRRFVMSKR
jgi:ubiquinone/menaquinone biosynthesis C-methylase UbiE